MNRHRVVLLPGLLCDARVWQAQLAELSFADCRVPSYGEMDALPRIAQAVIDSIDAERFSLAGHSMGGRIALEIARRVPQRVERLALLDSGVDALAPGEAGVRERERRMALLEIARHSGMRTMGRDWAQGMVHPSRLDTPVFTEIVEMIARFTPDIVAAQMKALLARPDAGDVLAGLRCPTLLLCGRQDSWSPLSRHERMQAMCPRSRLVVIEDCGHMSTMERPAEVSRALVDWMAR